VTEYAFKHPLTQEVALGSQLQERRAKTHGRVARAFQAAHPDRLDEHAALLAHHYEEAGDLDEAARHHRRAARWLLKSDASESRAHWHRVLELVVSLDETPEWQRLELEAADRLLSNGWRFGNVGEEERQLAERGIALAEHLGDRDALSSITWGYAISLSCDGQLEAAEKPARRAVELAEELDFEAKVLSRSILFDVFWHSGRVAEAAALWEEISTRIAPDYTIGVDRVGFSMWSWWEGRAGICHGLMGRPGAARPLLTKALEFAREHKEEEVASWILSWSGPQFEELTGEARYALSNTQQATELAARCGSPLSTTGALYQLGWAELLHGFPTEAVATLERARHQHLVAKQARAWTDLTTGLLAEAYLAVGQEQRAREMAEAPILVPDAWTNLLRARLSQARVFRALDGATASDRIAGLLTDADRLVEKSGARAYAPLVAEEWARLTALTNDEPEGRSQLDRARELYRDVGATGHVQRLSEELGE